MNQLFMQNFINTLNLWFSEEHENHNLKIINSFTNTNTYMGTAYKKFMSFRLYNSKTRKPHYE